MPKKLSITKNLKAVGRRPKGTAVDIMMRINTWQVRLNHGHPDAAAKLDVLNKQLNNF